MFRAVLQSAFNFFSRYFFLLREKGRIWVAYGMMDSLTHREREYGSATIAASKTSAASLASATRDDVVPGSVVIHNLGSSAVSFKSTSKASGIGVSRMTVMLNNDIPGPQTTGSNGDVQNDVHCKVCISVVSETCLS